MIVGGFNLVQTHNDGQNNFDLRIRVKSTNWLKSNSFIVSSDGNEYVQSGTWKETDNYEMSVETGWME